MKGNNRYTSFLILTLLLFLFWMAVTASLSFSNMLLGAFTAFFTSFFTSNVLYNKFDKAITLPVLLKFPFYAVALIWEIIKANIDVAMIVLNPGLPIDPRIFHFRTRLKGDVPLTVFAMSINLTPGTVVVDIQDAIFGVHALAARHEEGLLSGQMEEAVARLFGQELTPATQTEASL